MSDASEIASGVAAGDRRSLARAITLVESTRPADRDAAAALLAAIRAPVAPALRLAVTGAPGAGKSTLIDALGARWLDEGRRVAVLAVDPSSPRSSGSVLGDKTRMVRLGRSASAFVRPSSSAGTRGGTHPRTGEALSLCEAAGFDRVIVETVGVGQVESDVVDLVDCTVLVVPPNAGDDVQAAKRGMLDLCDLLVVSKADGALRAEAAHARDAYADVLARLGGSAPGVHAVSAVEGSGVETVLRALEGRWEALRASGELGTIRRRQLRARFRRALGERFEAWLDDDAALRAECRRLESLVEQGERLPQPAAEELLAGLRQGPD